MVGGFQNYFWRHAGGGGGQHRELLGAGSLPGAEEYGVVGGAK